MHVNFKKTALIIADLILGGYIVAAFTMFHKPDETGIVCNKVNINVQDETANGFINALEIKKRLQRQKLYPLGQQWHTIDVRTIEETLRRSPFVKTAECYKTQDGHVDITLTQRMPTVRIKADNGADYYLDDSNRIMPNSHYTSDLIVVTGRISEAFAQNYLAFVAQWLMKSDLWRNQVEQIHVLPDRGIELIPRVGNHVVFLGYLPVVEKADERPTAIAEFMQSKMKRLEIFYKKGLSQAGWNKYERISLEFDNQIICKKWGNNHSLN